MPGRARSTDAVEVAAPAKLNLFLRVLGRRYDGYHDLQSLIVPISLADRLHVRAHASTGFRTLSLSLYVEGDPDLVRGVPADESNLVLRAAKALADRTGVRGFAEFVLDKRVPSAAGLGGGSADAAAALSALNELWGVRLDRTELADLGAGVGADVPALLAGAPVIVEGTGRVVGRCLAPPMRWALVTFDAGVSTREAFGWWDGDGSTGPDPLPLVAALSRPADRRGPLPLFNDLEGPVASRHPRIARAKELLLEAGATAAVMSGSGPSVAGLLPARLPWIDKGVERALEELSGRPVRHTGSVGLDALPPA